MPSKQHQEVRVIYNTVHSLGWADHLNILEVFPYQAYYACCNVLLLQWLNPNSFGVQLCQPSDAAVCAVLQVLRGVVAARREQDKGSQDSVLLDSIRTSRYKLAILMDISLQQSLSKRSVGTAVRSDVDIIQTKMSKHPSKLY
jgi:hypothetical protein